MRVINSLMSRLGYVQLKRFGLQLTSEGRVIATRPATLDDGFGSRVVGWEEHDLAAMELNTWSPPAQFHRDKPARAETTITERAKITSAQLAHEIAAADPGIVATETIPGEEEWEWEIARARAAVDAATETQPGPLTVVHIPLLPTGAPTQSAPVPPLETRRVRTIPPPPPPRRVAKGTNSAMSQPRVAAPPLPSVLERRP